MTKLLWHSNGPWVGSGYGQQTALWVPRIAALGYEVAISAYHGLQGSVREWQGHTVYPVGEDIYGSDVLAGHAKHFGADLVITLMDVFALNPEPWADELKGKVACWMPVDTDDGGGLTLRGISLADHLRLAQSAAQPIAMSRFGERQLKAAGHSPLYVPHGIDCTVFRPPEDKQALKVSAGLAGKFIIGINAANRDKSTRKAWTEQLAAFAKFHRRRPDTALMVHSDKTSKRGINLVKIARDMGITAAVCWSDPYVMTAGLATPQMVAATYGLMDLYSGCTMAEGFGLPIVEAQACGVPTVVTDGSAMSETGCGWKVQGEPVWAEGHAAWWRKPSIDGIVRAYQKAYDLWQRNAMQAKSAAARQHALGYDADRVLAEYWKPVLERLEAQGGR